MESQRRVSNRRVSPGGGRPSAPWTTTHYLLPRPQRGWHGARSGGPGWACSHFPPGGRRVGERGLGRAPQDEGQVGGWTGREEAACGGWWPRACKEVTWGAGATRLNLRVSLCVCAVRVEGKEVWAESSVGWARAPPTVGVRVTAAQKPQGPATQGPWSQGHLRGALAPPVQAGARRPVPRRSRQPSQPQCPPVAAQYLGLRVRKAPPARGLT